MDFNKIIEGLECGEFLQIQKSIDGSLLLTPGKKQVFENKIESILEVEKKHYKKRKDAGKKRGSYKKQTHSEKITKAMKQYWKEKKEPEITIGEQQAKVLNAILQGKTRYSEISQASGVSMQSLGMTLQALVKKCLIERVKTGKYTISESKELLVKKLVSQQKNSPKETEILDEEIEEEKLEDA